MKITDAIIINTKKLKYRTSKALFLIIPIVILVSLSIIISSQTKNFQKAMDEIVFGQIEEENTVLELNYQMDSTPGGGRWQFMLEENEFTESDLEKIKSIENVTDASINYNIPINNISTSDLFDNTEVSINELSALNINMAGLYTQEDFSYTEGNAIPIILNAGSFIEQYEDWQDQDSITIEMKGPREMSEGITEEEGTDDPMQSTPIQSKAIDYNKDDLIGKEITIKFGGFDQIEDYETERDMGEVTFTKLTNEEIATLEAERKAAIDEYFNYDILSAGVTYTFKVVGVIEEEGGRTAYIPEDFANVLLNDYTNIAEQSIVADVSTDLLNSTFTGLTFDGTELTSSNPFGGFGGGMRPPGFGQNQDSSEEESETYEIPGLVIEVDEDDTTEVVGIYTEDNLFEDIAKTGDTINIKIDSIYNRTKVADELNDLGYAFQDINNLEVFNSIQDTLAKVAIGVIAGFIILTVAVIILTMSKFVSDSTKEIGVYRAVGFTKKNIVTIFLSQSILYTTVGYGVGVLIGFVGNLAIAALVSKWFDSLVASTIEETFNVVKDVEVSYFTNIDIESIAMLSGILLFVTLVISFIPAIRASNISPVEAIKK